MLANELNCLGNFERFSFKFCSFTIRLNTNKLTYECNMANFPNLKPGQIHPGIKIKTKVVKIMRIH